MTMAEGQKLEVRVWFKLSGKLCRALDINSMGCCAQVNPKTAWNRAAMDEEDSPGKSCKL